MKKSTVIFFFFVSIFLKIQAQDYLISFTGTGGSTSVDSVQVRNLTQNTSLTLNGTDVLHLMVVVGIDQTAAQSAAGLFIYPNPMNESSFVEFDAVSSGNATIEVCDITGKQVAQTHNMLPGGRHTFTVSGLTNGIYTLSIVSAAYFYSGKIVCTSISPGNGKINYVSTKLKSSAQSRLKSVQSLIPMQYNDGDQLLFTCFSGIYSTVIPLVPTQNQTVTANFVACTDADNNNYATVTIDTQTWMAENLNVGIRINGIQEQTNNASIEKYCYNDDEANCALYGGLYQWDEMMQYATAAGTKGICPNGWHIPTDGEWSTLTTLLGGVPLAGGRMKSTGTIEAGTGLWSTPNTGATNVSGFTAVPAGYRGSNGTFSNIDNHGYWWSSTENVPSNAWSRTMYYDNINVDRYSFGSITGFSVRCFKNL